MKRKLFLAVSVLCFIGTYSFAQIAVGARGGIDIPNLTAPGSNPVSNGYSSKLGIDAAVFVNIPITKTFSIQPELEYSQQGGKKEGIQAFPVPDEFSDIPLIKGNKYMYVDLKSKAKLNYLLLPILAKFGWNFHFSNTVKPTTHHFRFYVDVGPFVGYLINAHQELSHTKTKIYKTKDGETNILPGGGEIDIGQYTNTNRNIYENIHNFNAGVSGNVGLAYHFSKNSVFIEIGGNYGFLNIQKGNENGKNHTGAATLAIGYARQF